MPARSLAEEQLDDAVVLLRELVARHGRQQTVADLLGCRQSFVSGVINGKEGVSAGFLDAIWCLYEPREGRRRAMRSGRMLGLPWETVRRDGTKGDWTAIEWMRLYLKS